MSSDSDPRVELTCWIVLDKSRALEFMEALAPWCTQFGAAFRGGRVTEVLSPAESAELAPIVKRYEEDLGRPGIKGVTAEEVEHYLREIRGRE